MASQQAQAEDPVQLYQEGHTTPKQFPSASSCPPPMISRGIRPYDDCEGLNDEQARLATGRVMIDAGRQPEGTGSNNVEGHSDTVSLGTGTAASDVANILDLCQDPMDIL